MKIIKTAKWKEKIPGGRAKGKKPSDYDNKELEKGKKVEKEHTEIDKDIPTEISMDHLEEFPDYYIGLTEMEKKLKKKMKKEKK